MFERIYRRRLDADLTRWQADGVITPTTSAAIRGALLPMPPAIGIATVVAIVGGLLIAAAFLAFIAANWTVIPRPARFVILLAGIFGAYGIGAAFTYRQQKALADLAVGVGAIIFGAAIALVGQMYHLGEDFAGGMMLWSAGALVAAGLTGSRGALAVALAAGCLWSGTRMFEALQGPHLPFVAFWLIAAGLAIAWNSVVARHLVAVTALVWWGVGQFSASVFFSVGGLPVTFAAGAALLFGAGLALASLRVDTLRLFGMTLSTYGAFGFAITSVAAALIAADPPSRTGAGAQFWVIYCGVIGVVLAFAAAANARRAGPIFAALCAGLVLFAVTGIARPGANGEPWLLYALLLGAMLCLVVSGMLDEVQPRVVAGWLGLAATIAAITWVVRGSLLRRAIFLGIAGLSAVGLAAGLGVLLRKDREK